MDDNEEYTKELLLLNQIKLYPNNLSFMTKEELEQTESFLISKIKDYFKQHRYKKVKYPTIYIKICLTLFHRIISANNNDWNFIKNAFDEETIIKNYYYIDAFCEQIVSIIGILSEEDITLIAKELKYLERTASIKNKGVKWQISIKKFANYINDKLCRPLIFEPDYADYVENNIKEACKDIIIKDISKIKQINEEQKKEIISIIYRYALFNMFRDDPKFRIACESMLSLDGEKEVIDLIKKHKKMEANLVEYNSPSLVTNPLYDIKDIKKRH